MKWFRYRILNSYGTDGWLYKYFLDDRPTDDKEEMEETFEELIDMPTFYSEHYRGIEWEQVEKPPVEVVEQERSRAEKRLRYWKGVTKEFSEMEQT